MIARIVNKKWNKITCLPNLVSNRALKYKIRELLSSERNEGKSITISC